MYGYAIICLCVSFCNVCISLISFLHKMWILGCIYLFLSLLCLAAGVYGIIVCMNFDKFIDNF